LVSADEDGAALVCRAQQHHVGRDACPCWHHDDVTDTDVRRRHALQAAAHGKALVQLRIRLLVTNKAPVVVGPLLGERDREDKSERRDVREEEADLKKKKREAR
jgi:hypothetical protein